MYLQFKEAYARSHGDLGEVERLAAEDRIAIDQVDDDEAAPGPSSKAKRQRKEDEDPVMATIQRQMEAAQAELTAVRKAMSTMEPTTVHSCFLEWVKACVTGANDKQWAEFQSTFIGMQGRWAAAERAMKQQQHEQQHEQQCPPYQFPQQQFPPQQHLYPPHQQQRHFTPQQQQQQPSIVAVVPAGGRCHSAPTPSTSSDSFQPYPSQWRSTANLPEVSTWESQSCDYMQRYMEQPMMPPPQQQQQQCHQYGQQQQQVFSQRRSTQPSQTFQPSQPSEKKQSQPTTVIVSATSTSSLSSTPKTSSVSQQNLPSTETPATPNMPSSLNLSSISLSLSPATEEEMAQELAQQLETPPPPSKDN